MYTDPEFRRQGIARRLMQTMIDWCRKEGFVRVDLHASDKGRPLYESLGFEPTNEMRLNLRKRVTVRRNNVEGHGFSRATKMRTSRASAPGVKLSRIPQLQTSGAKALAIFAGCGTAEAVPFHGAAAFRAAESRGRR